MAGMLNRHSTPFWPESLRNWFRFLIHIHCMDHPDDQHSLHSVKDIFALSPIHERLKVIRRTDSPLRSLRKPEIIWSSTFVTVPWATSVNCKRFIVYNSQLEIERFLLFSFWATRKSPLIIENSNYYSIGRTKFWS